MNQPTQSDTIIVRASTPRFLRALATLLKVEGGFVDDKDDRGGATNFGISLRFLASEGAFDIDGDGVADFDLDMDGDIDRDDIRQLLEKDAQLLYYRCFWLKLECEDFPFPIGEMLFDQGVNGGRHAARKLLQQAINQCADRYGLKPRLIVDGMIGPVTQTMLRAVLDAEKLGMDALVEAYRDVVRDRYRKIVARYPSQKRFLRGWLARAERLGR